MPPPLPIDALHDAFSQARSRNRPVIVTSPTGSGKSTRVPVWASASGPVLVVEPRRVVARALAQRVCQETGTRPGDRVGWVVRGEAVRGADTRILFVTPGVALRMLGTGGLDRFPTWILDEFHERRADVDALLAWMRWKEQTARVVLLSATLDAPTLAHDLGAEILAGEGRTYPVDIGHRVELGQTWPQGEGLPLRLERALRSLEQTTGTVLVFLPGTGEIGDAAAWLAGRIDAEICPLHGGLSLDEQGKALRPTGELRIVLSTNVAESALTVPDVVAVIDSGLERRIVRANGFPSLELAPISQASADQRAGRAGRTAAGRCLRMWSGAARLEARPKPGIQVDDPDDWLLPLLVAGCDPWSLPWIDKPRADGLRDAFDRFRRAGLWLPDPWIPAGGAVTDRGRSALELPLPPDLAGICLGLVGTAALRDAVALACALAQARPLLRPKPSVERFFARRELAGGSDDLALLSRVVRCELDQALDMGIRLPVWRDARMLWERLSGLLGMEGGQWPRAFQSDTLVQALCRVEPRLLRMRRGPAGKEEYAVGDGAGLRPSRSSLVFSEGAPELVVAVSTHGGLDAQGRRRVWIEAAEPVSKSRAQALDLGRVEVARAVRQDDAVWAQWKLRVGNTLVGQKEGLATDPVVWAAAVAKAVPTSGIQEIQQKLDERWLERCLRIGRWVAPPEDATVWLQRELEARLSRGEVQPPVWPDPLPSPPVPMDAPALRQAFPAAVEGVGGLWEVRWEVRTGKVRLVAPTKSKAPVPVLAHSQGWTIKIG